MKNNDNRRRFDRFPVSDSLRWQSGSHGGDGQILDISPTGAGFCVRQQDAFRFADTVTLDVELLPGTDWRVTQGARIVQIVPHDADTCRVGVRFPTSQAREPER